MPDKKHGLGKGMGALFGDLYDREDELVEKIVAIEDSKKKSSRKPAESKKVDDKKSVTAAVVEPKEEEAAAVAMPQGSDDVTVNAIRAVYVPITSISPNPNQPRKTFD